MGGHLKVHLVSPSRLSLHLYFSFVYITSLVGSSLGLRLKAKPSRTTRVFELASDKTKNSWACTVKFFHARISLYIVIVTFSCFHPSLIFEKEIKSLLLEWLQIAKILRGLYCKQFYARTQFHIVSHFQLLTPKSNF
jgi:hypothetical protein